MAAQVKDNQWYEYTRYCLCGQQVDIYSEWVAPRTFANHYYAADVDSKECPTCGRELNKDWVTVFSLSRPPLYKLDKHGRLIVPPSPTRPTEE